MFRPGDKVRDIMFPTLVGEVIEILPAENDLPEMLNVRWWIPPNEPGFRFTGVYENMLTLPGEVRGLTAFAADAASPR
jgi:hypothetical protein